MIFAILLISLLFTRDISSEAIGDMTDYFYDADFRSLMQELSAEKFISNLNLSGRQNLSEDCSKDLEILANGTKTFVDNIITAREFGKRDIDTKLIIPIIDACGKLSPGILRGRSTFMGSFEECMAIDYYDDQALRRIRGGYFRILLQIPIANSTTNFMWDVCLPASCTGKELHTAFANGSLPLVGKYIAEVIDGFEKVPKYVTASYIVGTILLLTIAICVVAGIIDYYYTNVKKQKPKGLGYTILMNFSLYKNCNEVIALTPAKKGQITALNCIRAVSMIWIIIGHTFSISMATFDNPLDVREMVKTYYGQFLSNAYLSVDSFFFLTGALLAFLKLKEFEKEHTILSARAWLMFYIHRILRMSPAYYLLLVFYGFIFTSWLYNMPMLMTPGPADDSCRNNWWINFLYLNNFIRYKNMCLVVSWYLATDFQIYLFSPLLLLPFGLFGAFAGLAMAAVLLVISTGLNIFQVYYFYLPPSSFRLAPQDPRTPKQAFKFWIYYMPYIRCQVVIIGMLVGTLLQRKKSMRINKVLNVVLWILAFASIGTALFGLHDWINGHQWELFPRAMYSAFSRPLWALGLSWMVISSYYGYGAFCAYLVQILVIAMLFGIDHGQLHYSGLCDWLIRAALPNIVLTFAVALFWTCMFELPFQKLENMLLGKKKRSPAVKPAQGAGVLEEGKSTKQ